MHNILLQIIGKKKAELPVISQKGLFKKQLLSAKGIALIAEIKFASPTEKSLGNKEDLVKRARSYEAAGADAISIITEKHFFKGESGFIKEVKKISKLPVLQKDFVIDVSQIYEAKSIGSDALLFIARLVDRKTLQQFVTLSQNLDIEPVVEINNQEDLEKAITTETVIIAVNARNLETFKIDISDACALMRKIPERFIKLGFSGINSIDEVKEYQNAGAKGVLIGTSLMKAKNIEEFISSLRTK